MLHFKAPGQFLPEGSPAKDWGPFVQFVEVDDDRRAARQVDVFKNGNVLRYDQRHPRDAIGYLTGLRFSHKPKWMIFFPGVEIITATDFEAVWRNAKESSLVLRGQPKPIPRHPQEAPQPDIA